MDQQARRAVEQALLKRWRLVLDPLRASHLGLGGLARAGPAPVGLCLILPGRGEPPNGNPGLTRDVLAEDQRIRLMLAPGADQQRPTDETRAPGGRCLPVPPCFRGEPRVCARNLRRRDVQIQYQIRRLEHDLRRLALAQGPNRSIGVLQRIDWFLQEAPGIQCDEAICGITGWTSTTDRSVLEGASRSWASRPR